MSAVWHFTPASRVERILSEGLIPHVDARGACNQCGVYVVPAGDDRSHFVSMLYEEPAVCLEVDVTGLELLDGDDWEPDRPEWAVPCAIPPERIRVLDAT